jgi:hypothetical protein
MGIPEHRVRNYGGAGLGQLTINLSEHAIGVATAQTNFYNNANLRVLKLV